MTPTSTCPSLVKALVFVPVLFLALMLRANHTCWLSGVVGLVDEHRLGQIMARYTLLASPFLFAGSICLVRGRLGTGAWFVALPLIGLTLLTGWVTVIAMRITFT